MSRVEHIIKRRQGVDRRARVIFDKAGPGRRRARVEQVVVQAYQPPKDGKPAVPAVYEQRGVVTKGRHQQGGEWWSEQYADLVERRRPDGSYKPRDIIKPPAPKRQPRPVKQPSPAVGQTWVGLYGVTRQAARRLYRSVCKATGHPWQPSTST